MDRNANRVFDPPTETTVWGSTGDIPVRGDWNGDGIDDLGVYSGGAWFLDLNGDGSFDPATEVRGWGEAGWRPAPGDWNGDGVTDLGVVSPDSTWFRDLNGDGLFDPATEVLGWGSAGDRPVVADWNGDGADEVAVYSGGVWFLDLNGDGVFDPATEIKGWGEPAWIPLPGDWNGDGVWDLGVVSPDMVWFRDLDGDMLFNPATEAAGWGSPGDIPLRADWNADGRHDLGVFSAGVWIADFNGNGVWEPAAGEMVGGFGQAGDTPLPGRWGGAEVQGPISLIPADGDPAFQVNRRPLVRLLQAVDPASVTGQTVWLSKDGATVPATLAVSPDGHYISVRPDAPLSSGTDYTFTINGLKTAAGSPIAGTMQSHFTTATGFPASFSLQAQSSQDYGTVPLNAKLHFQFWPEIDPTTWRRDVLTLTDETTGGSIPLDCEIDNSWVHAICEAPHPLPVGTQITLVGNGVEGLTDPVGNNYHNRRLTSLQVGFEPDTTPPQILEVVPFDGATGYPASSDIHVRLSEPTARTWPGTVFELRRNGALIMSYLNDDSFGAWEHSVRVVPAGNHLEPGVTYHLTIRNVRDLAGNVSVGEFTTAFSTAPDGTQTDRSIEFWPLDGIDLPLNPLLQLTFQQPLTPGSVTPQTVRIETQDRQALPASVTLLNATQVSIRPQSNLEPNTEYAVQLEGVTDATGFPYGFRRSFSTGDAADTVAPAVVGVSPPHGAEGAPLRPVVQVRFSEPVYDPPGTAGVLRLEDASGATVGTGPFGSVRGQELISQDFTLAPDSEYRVIVEGFVDAVGQPTPRFESTFRTGSGSYGSQLDVLSSTPENGAAGVSLAPTITIQMSRQLNPLSVSEETVALDTAGIVVPTTVELTGGGTVLVLTPRVALLPDTSYSVDLAVYNYAASGFWGIPFRPITFRTVSGPADTTPPQVISMTPAEGSIVSVGDGNRRIQLELGFSEAINPSTLNPGSLLVGFGSRSASIHPPAVSSDGLSARVEIPYPYEQEWPNTGDTQATVVVTTAVQDLSGNAMASDFIGRFRIVEETAELVGFDVFEVLPLQSFGAPSGTPISILYTAPFEDQSLDRAFYIAEDGVLVDGVFTASAENRVLQFTPNQPFSPGALVQVFGREPLKPGGVYSSSNVNASFYVADPSSPGPPQLEQTGPRFNFYSATNPLAPPNVLPMARFSEPLDPASVTSTSVRFTRSGVEIEGTRSLTHGGTVVEFRPSQPLQPGRHDFFFSAELKDLSGEALEYWTSLELEIGDAADVHPPTVIGVSPPDGSTDVPLNARIGVGFSEVMNAPSISRESFELRKNGVLVPISEVMIEDDQQSFWVRPLKPLDPATVYTVQMAGAVDGAGFSASIQQWSFTTGSTIDTASPKTAGFVPLGQQVGVASTFTVRFDERIDPSNADVLIRDTQDQRPLPGATVVGADGRSVSFKPTQDLAVGTFYYFNVTVSDLAGNRQYPHTQFQTGFQANSPGPTVISSTLADGATTVSPFFDLQIEFDTALDEATITPENIRLLDGGVVVPTVATLRSDAKALRINAETPLAPGRAFILEIRNLAGALGNTMAAPWTIAFTTRSGFDFAGPTYLWSLWDQGVAPAPSGWAGFHRDLMSSVVFSEQVDPATVGPDSIFYEVNGAPWPTAVQIDVDGKTVLLSPVTPLPANSLVGVQVTTAVRDKFGNPHAGPGAFQNSVRIGQDLSDQTAPRVATVIPPDGATDVPLNVDPRVVFSEPLDPRFPQTPRLLDPMGNPVTRGGLSPGTTYQIVVEGGRDFAGNLLEPFVSQFTTSATILSDQIHPSITSHDPVQGATNVSTTPVITAVFSEPVIPTKVTLQVSGFTEPGVPVEWELSADGLVLTTRPLQPLPVSTYATVVYEGGDAAGNPLIQYYYFQFQTSATPTIPDPTAPRVLSVNPPDGATGVVDRKVRLTFSEPVHPGTLGGISVFRDGELLNYVSTGRVGDGSTIEMDVYGGPSGGVITVVVSNLVTDVSGNPAEPFLSRFELAPTPPDGDNGPFPQIVRPTDGARDVTEDSKVHIFFNGPLDPASADGSVLVSEDGVLLPGSLLLSAENHVLTYTPSRPYRPGARIRVFVDLERLRTASGAVMGNYVARSEFTVRGGDAETPYLRVLRRSPTSNRATPKTQFMVELDRPLNPVSVNSEAVTLSSGGVALDSQITLEGQGRVIRVKPAAPLADQTGVFLKLSAAVKGLDGSAFDHPSGFWMSLFVDSGSEEPTPTVSRIAPSDGSVGVGVNATLTLEFSGLVNEITVNPSTVRLESWVGQVIPTTFQFQSFHGPFTRVVITPNTPLPALSRFDLVVDGVEDEAGRFVPMHSISFTTSGGVDFVGPTLSSFSPETEDAPLNAAIVAGFSEALDPVTVSSASAGLYVGSVPVAGQTSLLPDSRTVIFEPDAPLEPYTYYSFQVTHQAGRILDLSGNPASGGAGFMTGSASISTPPAAVKVLPEDGTQGFGINGKLVVEFDRPVKHPPVGSPGVRVEQGGVAIPIRVDMLGGNRILEITPLGLFDPLTPYVWTVEGIEDFAGNVMVAPLVQNFSTGLGLDTTAPQAIGSSPVDQAVNFPRDGEFVVTFDEPLHPVVVSQDAWILRVDNLLVESRTRVSADGKTVTLTPVAPLPAQATVSLASYPRDLSDNQAPSPLNIVVTTGN